MRTEQERESAKKPCLRRLLEGWPLCPLEASLVVLTVIIIVIISPGGPAGAQVKREWVVTYDANEPSLSWRWDTMFGAGIDAAGNLHVVGTVTRDCPPGKCQVQWCKVQTYGPGGNLLWDVEYPQLWYIAVGGCAVDPQGNTYVGGSAGDNPSTQGDFLTLKFDPAGHLCWSARRDFEGRWERPPKLVIDESGNVYVGGLSNGGANYWPMVKYDSSGNEVWATVDTLPVAHTQFCLDASGNLYGGFSEVDYFLRKYDPQGQPLWTATYDGPAHGYETLGQIAVDAEGGVYLTGASEAGDGFISDCATVKFSRDGELLWAASYDTPDHMADGGCALAVDATGNVHVIGQSERLDGPDWVTLKYDREGNELWARRHPNYDGGPGWRPPIALDPAGNVYVGLSVRDEGTTVLKIVKYDREGNEIWAYSDLGGLGDGFTAGWEWGAWLFVDDAYNVYFATTVWNGRAEEGGTEGDFLVAKLSQGSPSFRRGAANGDGEIDISDAVFTLGYLFRAGSVPGCLDAADADDNGSLEITDAIFTLNHLFLGGPPPPAPTGSCGPDPTEDKLGCASFEVCP